MSDDNELKSCAQCGEKVAAAELLVDEETGLLLCAVCARELASCGCSDEED